MRAAAERQAGEISERERAEAQLAGEAAYCIVKPLWACHLGVSAKASDVLGCIYSFQRQGLTFRQSRATIARELGISSSEQVWRILDNLVAKGYLVRTSNGCNKPATYTVDVAACVLAARANHWEG